MLIQLTQKWADSWIIMFKLYESIFECIIEQGITDIKDVNINKIMKWLTFIDHDNVVYKKEEEKKAKQNIIHAYVAIKDRIEIIYWTTNPKEILEKIRATITKLENMKDKLPV